MIDGNGQFRCAMIDSIEFGVAFGSTVVRSSELHTLDLAACCHLAEDNFLSCTVFGRAFSPRAFLCSSLHEDEFMLGDSED